MTTPIQTRLQKADGTERSVIIEPVIEKDGEGGFRATGTYKIYKDVFEDETHLFTEPAEIGEVNDDLADADNPDYLGELQFNGDTWTYAGDLLAKDEQGQVAAAILMRTTRSK